MYCFAKFCRLCLKESNTLINIFYVDKDNEKIVDKMKFLRPDLISSYQGLPSWICPSCRTQVNRTYNLFKKWIRSHETLKKYINKFRITRRVSKNILLNIKLIGFEPDMNEISCDETNDDEEEEELEIFRDNSVQTDDFKFDLLGNKINKQTISTQTNDSVETKDKQSLQQDESISIRTENRVIEDLFEIVKMSEDIQNIQSIESSENSSPVLEELIEIAINNNDENKTFDEQTNNILEKAIKIAEISDIKKETKPKNLFLQSSSNLDFTSETATETCDSIFSDISNEFQYSSYPEIFSESQNNVDLEAVKKISGYLQESFQENNIFNMDDKIYNENCETLMNDILETATLSDINSKNSEDLDSNLTIDRLVNNSQPVYSFSTDDLSQNSNLQVLSVNNTWSTVNGDLLSKDHFALLESVEKNLNSTVCSLNINSVGNQNDDVNVTSYTSNYFESNSFISSDLYHLNISDGSECSPTTKKDFSFSEDSNGNEIPSKKFKTNKKKNNTLESKFYQVFQDMEIASRHCNTPVECIISNQDSQITYLVDRNNSIYSCKSCNINYKSISPILEHSQLHGTIQELTENEYLSINVDKPEKSVKIVVNHEVKKFVCKKCDKNFSEFAALYRHVSVHVSNQKFICDECGKSFPVYRYLSLHKLTHSRIRVYACKLCPKTFRAKDTLRTHEIVHHENNDKPYVCDLCGKGFIIEQYLKYHMSRHNKETGRICHICGKILKNEELCYKHIKEKHLVISFKECDVCHKTFHNNRNLKAHMKLHGTKDFKCDECDKEFFFSRDLKNHKLLHSGCKPHSCDHCGKSFRVLGALYKHKRTHKAKPYVCTTCQKGFHQLKSLQVHERVHSGLKPYKCEECNKSYVHINVYYQHMKKFHPQVMSL